MSGRDAPGRRRVNKAFSPTWTDAYVGMVQYLFLLTWIVYVIFLGDLAARVGVPEGFVPKLLLADQLLFACADLIAGYYADRIMTWMRRLGPWLVVSNLLSCAAFVALPWIGTQSPTVFVCLTVVWVLTASVLRAPLYGLIARRGAEPGRTTAMGLMGMGLASACAPFLGVWLKGADPILPFVLSGVVLALMTLGMMAWEPRPGAKPEDAPSSTAGKHGSLAGLLIFLMCLGAAVQLHVFFNSAPLFKAVADAASLPWLMPVFWVGFSLAVYPGARLIEQYGGTRVMLAAALAGVLAMLAVLSWPGMTVLLPLQAILGIAWGASFLACLMLAGELGHYGRESRLIAVLFAGLAVVTAGRISLGLAGLAQPANTLPLTAGLWGVGALVALALWRRQALKRTGTS